MPPPTNEGWEYRAQLGTSAAGETVLDHLARCYRHSSAETWASRLERGEVTLDGAKATAGQRLRSGQLLVWTRPPWAEPEVPLSYEVIHEDEDLLVVAKPSGLPTVPAGGFLAHTLLTLVRARDPEATPMHRLGRGTSGLVVFARTASARARLQAAWREREIDKVYRALCAGLLPPEPFAITAAIGPVAHPVLGEVHAAASGGRPAHSEVRRVAVRGEDSLADVRILTGRPHQIRIHLAYAGHPLVGDPLYGPGGVPMPGTRTLPGDLGYHLHAWRLAFTHPGSRRRIELEASLPERLRAEEPEGPG